MIRAKGRSAALARPAIAVVGALALSGCVSLFPKTKPSQLYRFDYRASAASVSAPAAARVDVYLASGSFPQEAASDQILTLTGERAAYIAASRWVAPAVVLWDQAVRQAFETAAGRARLIARGEPVRSQYALRLDVQRFETDYDGTSPSVLVRVHATLTRTQNREVVAEQSFEARSPASADRVSAIVAAYDQALDQALSAVVGWTNSEVSAV